MGSECGPKLTCLKNLREDIKDPITRKMATHTCQNKQNLGVRVGAAAISGAMRLAGYRGGKRRKSKKRRRRKRR